MTDKIAIPTAQVSMISRASPDRRYTLQAWHRAAEATVVFAAYDYGSGGDEYWNAPMALDIESMDKIIATLQYIRALMK